MSGEDAMYELTVDLPTLPKGEPIQIVGLGTFKNGSTYTVSKEEADGYRTYHTNQQDVFDDSGKRTGTEVVLGPTLLQASKTMFGVEVTSTSGEHKTTSKSVTTSDADTAKTQNQGLNNPRTIEGKSAKPSDKEGGDKS